MEYKIEEVKERGENRLGICVYKEREGREKERERGRERGKEREKIEKQKMRERCAKSSTAVK